MSHLHAVQTVVAEGVCLQIWAAWRDHAPDWLRLPEGSHPPQGVLGHADLGHPWGAEDWR